jgi:hypothetical protein
VREIIDAAIAGTVLYRPERFDTRRATPRGSEAPALRIEVTGETTAAAARRLVETDGVARVVALNFSSLAPRW